MTKPPRQLLPPIINTTLKDVVRGKDDPTWKRTLVEDHIHTYGALKEATLGRDDFNQRRALVEGQIRTDDDVSTAVCTDGSKNKTGNTPCSFYGIVFLLMVSVEATGYPTACRSCQPKCSNPYKEVIINRFQLGY